MKIAFEDIIKCEYIASLDTITPNVYCINDKIFITDNNDCPNCNTIKEWAKTHEVLHRYKSEQDISNAKRLLNNALVKHKHIEYLSSTDWVVTKLNEAQLLGLETTTLIEKYKDVLGKRAEARDTINSLEVI